MFKTLFRLLLILVVVGALIWFFAPRFFNDAANSLISSVNSSVAQAQGLAQFVPAGVNSVSNTKGNLQVNLNGLTPNTTYELYLDQTQCGALTKDLGPVKSDANGSFYIEVPLTTLDTTKTWFVDILQQGQSVACGQLQTNQQTGTQAISASQGPNDFGPQPTSANGSPTSNSPLTNNTTNNSSTGLPNTGANPGSGQQYDNNQYPRKY